MSDDAAASSYGSVREEDVVFTDALTHVGGSPRKQRRRSVLAVVSAAVLLAVVGAVLARGGGADGAAAGATSLAAAGKKHSDGDSSSSSGGGKHSKHSKSSSSDDDDTDDASGSKKGGKHSGGAESTADSSAADSGSDSPDGDSPDASPSDAAPSEDSPDASDATSSDAASDDASSSSSGGPASGASSGVSAVHGGGSTSVEGGGGGGKSGSKGVSATTQKGDHTSDWSCLEDDSVSIYKYTITSSNAPKDGKWADALMGCAFRNVTDTHGCSSLGKTSCFSITMAYGLHFVENKITHSGPYDIAYWDAYQLRLNDHSFENNKFNQFMHYSLAFYAPDLTDTVKHLVNNDISFLARKGVSPHDGHVYFTVIVQSPSGKVFELTSTTLDTSVLDNASIKRWKDADECPNCHYSQRYAREELDHWYTNFSQGIVHYTTDGLPSLMPVRNNIAVPSVSKVAQWMKKNVPSLEFKMEDGAGATGGSCRTLTANIPLYTETGFDMEVRFIENEDAHTLEHTVDDFVTYIEQVNANWTAPNYGWTAWYDRHLGLMFNSCPLDDYMKKFEEEDVSFHPHGRGGSTDNTDTAKDHCWTEGVQGYGIEMQGNFSFTYHDCYQVFDWCTWDTSPKVDNC